MHLPNADHVLAVHVLVEGLLDQVLWLVPGQHRDLEQEMELVNPSKDLQLANRVCLVASTSANVAGSAADGSSGHG